MKHLILFENWEESKQLSDFNDITGVFDGGDICDVEGGESYGIEDDIMSKYYFLVNGKKIFISKVEGDMDDHYTEIVIRLTDGKSYEISASWNERPNSHKKEYFKITSLSDNTSFDVDPQWVLDDFLANMGYGSYVSFISLFYPGCEVYYNNKKDDLPEIKLQN